MPASAYHIPGAAGRSVGCFCHQLAGQTPGGIPANAEPTRHHLRPRRITFTPPPARVLCASLWVCCNRRVLGILRTRIMRGSARFSHRKKSLLRVNRPPRPAVRPPTCKTQTVGVWKERITAVKHEENRRFGTHNYPRFVRVFPSTRIIAEQKAAEKSLHRFSIPLSRS